MGFLRAEPDKIDELEDADSVDDKQRDKPPGLAGACGIPEREALKDDRPDDEDEDEREEGAPQRRRVRRIEGEVVHISVG